jgi:hypothetical protein
MTSPTDIPTILGGIVWVVSLIAAIEAAAKKIDRAEAVRIWNENVERKMSNPGPSQFHWKE